MQKPADFLVPILAGLVWYGLTNYEQYSQNNNKNRALCIDNQPFCVFLSSDFLQCPCQQVFGLQTRWTVH